MRRQGGEGNLPSRGSVIATLNETAEQLYNYTLVEQQQQQQALVLVQPQLGKGRTTTALTAKYSLSAEKKVVLPHVTSFMAGPIFIGVTPSLMTLLLRLFTSNSTFRV